MTDACVSQTATRMTPSKVALVRARLLVLLWQVWNLQTNAVRVSLPSRLFDELSSLD